MRRPAAVDPVVWTPASKAAWLHLEVRESGGDALFAKKKGTSTASMSPFFASVCSYGSMFTVANPFAGTLKETVRAPAVNVCC